jgi:hypothetical protein
VTTELTPFWQKQRPMSNRNALTVFCGVTRIVGRNVALFISAPSIAGRLRSGV